MEANRWIETKNLSGDFDVKSDTFYFCPIHAFALSRMDDTIVFLNPETGIIREIELAVYSCSDACEVCNE